jgi:hypothetical protein
MVEWPTRLSIGPGPLELVPLEAEAADAWLRDGLRVAIGESD